MRKTLAFATCLYDLSKRGWVGHRTVDWMLANSSFVLGMDRDLVVFTDPHLKTAVHDRCRGPSVRIVAAPFEQLLGPHRAALVQRGTFQRNAQKQRQSIPYVQLMWSKYAMLELALKLTATSHLGWIDVAISHVAKAPPERADVFADPSDRPRVHVLRCFSKRDVDHPDYFRYVQGHLAGGLIVGARDNIRDLASNFWRATDHAASLGLAPLDEELLAYVVGQRVEDFSYSYGDYEDIMRNHDTPRGGDAHRKWIVDDARSRGLPDTMLAPSESLLAMFPDLRTFRPAFSPRSCYVLQDSEQEDYFKKHGGAPEARLIDWATQFIEHDETFVDVGAHVGTWAQHFALKCRQVHAFEPSPSTYARLRDGAQLARLSNVVCHEVALGARDEVDLHVVDRHGGWSTLRHRPELGAVITTERVRAAQLDDFDFEDVGVIKIDAEGFETDILRGAVKTLEKHRPTLLLEAWDHEWYVRERAELIAHVIDLGYGVVPVQGWPQMLLAEPKVKRRSPALASRTSDGTTRGPDDETDGRPEKTSPLAASAALAQALHSAASLSPDRPLLGLVMIVKNEVKRVASVLASYRPYIDAWTILDTGSTDGTQDVVRRSLDGIPGALHEEPFVNFATSRNRALELHGTATVFSIMPNGDVLEGGAELVSFLQSHRRDLSGAYRVRIAPGHYYHPLVMRTGFGWRYKWRTHECAVGPNTGPHIPGVTVVRDRGTRTDSEWRQRWERDLVLLNQDREDDPTDPRPYFYLGQTHECLGQYAEALPFFEQRAKMGGYFDEVYEAKFRVGRMMEKIGRPWAEVQQAYLEAYAHDPRRAEPLYAASQHWYEKGIHAVSRLFAVAAAETRKPQTDLFLDEDIYTWKSADRAAISSFYSGHKEDGRYWAEIALSWREGDERLRANCAFFAQSAAEMFRMEARSIDFVAEPGWHASNPSICVHEDRVRCVVRTVNYQLTSGNYITADGVIRTRNFLLDLDDHLGTTRSVEMVDRTGDVRSAFPVRGFEDARLFAWKGRWCATATVRDFTDHGRPEIALLQVGDDGSITSAEALRGLWSLQAQKNWMPAVDAQRDALRFIYATSLDGDVGSTVVFNVEETAASLYAGQLRYVVRPPVGADYSHGRLRGGSQAIKVDGGWLCCVHDVAFPASGRIYVHRFVFFDDDLSLVSMTDPFYFEKLGIEFCAGLALVGDDLVASYSVNDASARLGRFSLQRVRSRLRTDFVI